MYLWIGNPLCCRATTVPKENPQMFILFLISPQKHAIITPPELTRRDNPNANHDTQVRGETGKKENHYQPKSHHVVIELIAKIRLVD